MDLDLGIGNNTDEKRDEIASLIIIFANLLERASKECSSLRVTKNLVDEVIAGFATDLTKLNVPTETIEKAIKVCQSAITTDYGHIAATTIVSYWCLAFIVAESGKFANKITSELTYSNGDYTLEKKDKTESKPDTKSGNCTKCHKKTTKLCEGCSSYLEADAKVYYCNVGCQKSDWSMHQYQCQKNSSRRQLDNMAAFISIIGKCWKDAVQSDRLVRVIRKCGLTIFESDPLNKAAYMGESIFKPVTASLFNDNSEEQSYLNSVTGSDVLVLFGDLIWTLIKRESVTNPTSSVLTRYLALCSKIETIVTKASKVAMPYQVSVISGTRIALPKPTQHIIRATLGNNEIYAIDLTSTEGPILWNKYVSVHKMEEYKTIDHPRWIELEDSLKDSYYESRFLIADILALALHGYLKGPAGFTDFENGLPMIAKEVNNKLARFDNFAKNLMKDVMIKVKNNKLNYFFMTFDGDGSNSDITNNKVSVPVLSQDSAYTEGLGCLQG
jgi:hypothetical protein